jgi:hypothetical protein
MRSLSARLGIVVTLLVACAMPAAARADVEQTGGRIDTSGATTEPSDIAGIGGQPWVAWVGGPEGGSTGSQQVHVKRWTGTTWELVGGPLNANPASQAKSPKIVDVGGVAYVAWAEVNDGSGGNGIRVSRWNAVTSSWVAVGGSLLDAGAGFVDYVELAAIGGEPYVTWAQDLGGTEASKVVVKRFTAGAWQEVGTPGALLSSTTPMVYPQLTGIGGTPYLVFVDVSDGFGYPIRVARFTAGSWALVGGTQEGTEVDAGVGAAPQITAIDGQPAVLWYDVSHGTMFEGSFLRMTRWNGTTWVDVGPPLQDPAPMFGGPPAVVTIDDTPYAAWVTGSGTGELTTAYFDGSTWVDTGAAPPNTGSFAIARPALADIGGTPHMSWSDRAAVERIFAGLIAAEPGVIQLSASTYEGDEDDGSIAITVTREGSTAGTASVEFATADGTATSADYTGGSGVVNFADGDAAEGLIATVNDDGLHEDDETFSITISDPVNASLGTPTTATVTIDDDDPIDTQIFGGPSGPTNSSTASFAFTATPSAGATFECSLDGAGFTGCPSSTTLNGLAQGAHTFRVRAKNATDTDDSPAVRNFFVDTVAPTSTALLAPNGGSQLPGDSRYTGRVLASASASDPVPASGVAVTRCALDPPSPPTQFIDMPVCAAASTETPGVHNFYAASQDQAGNVEPVVVKRRFTIVALPDTTIHTGPEGETWLRTPFFGFSSNVGGATFQCRIDGGSFAPCTSPFTAPELSIGPHSFEVRAVSDGAEDPTPARRDFTVAGTSDDVYRCTIQPFMDLTFGFADLGPPPDFCHLSTGADFQRDGCESGSYKCVVTNRDCPVWARCTVTAKAQWFDADNGVDWILNAAVYQMSTGGPSNAQCTTGLNGDRCSTSETESAVRTPAPDSVRGGEIGGFCFADPGRSGVPEYRADHVRRLICELTVKIEPTTAAQAIAAGSSIQVVVPGAGTVTVAPGGRSRLATATNRAAIKPTTATATEAGVVTLKPKLSKGAKKKLKKKGKLSLSVSTTFAPAEGGESITQASTVKLTGKKKRGRK